MTAFSNGYSSDHERAYAALQHWTIRDGEANLAKLINALHRQRRIDVVAKIRWVMEDNPQVGWICRRQFVAHIFFFAFHLQSCLCSVWAWFTEGLRVGKQPKTGVGKLPEFEFMSWLFFFVMVITNINPVAVDRSYAWAFHHYKLIFDTRPLADGWMYGCNLNMTSIPPSIHFLSLLILHSGFQSCWRLSQLSWCESGVTPWICP